MRICSLSSGSKGNSIFVQSNKSKILVDCGHSGKMIELLLNSIGEKMSEIDAIFVTHEHSDHIKGVGVLSRRYDIPIIANEKTWIAMKRSIGEIAPKNILVFKTNTFFTYRDMDIHAISTFHDAQDPVAFIFYQKNQKISILTDTGIVSDNMKDAIRGSNIYLIEANHDIEMLKNGSYSPSLKRRILSDYGHLSNDLTKHTLEEILQGNGEAVILGHLSEENNLDYLAFSDVQNHLEDIGLDTNKDISLRVAPKLKADIITDLGGF